MRIWWTPWLPSGGFHFLHKIWEKLRNSPFPALVKSSFPWLSKHVKFFILLVSRSGSYIYIQTGQSKMKGPTLRLIHWNKLAAFSWASKVIRDFFGFALPRSRATISANQMTKTNPILVTCVFPRFKQVPCFFFEFPLVNHDFKLCSDWPLWLLWV